MKKLKERWGITSNFQIIIIFIVFGITGSVSAVISGPLTEYLIGDANINSFIKLLIRIIVLGISNSCNVDRTNNREWSRPRAKKDQSSSKVSAAAKSFPLQGEGNREARRLRGCLEPFRVK